jgi:hypothetical protein
MDTGALQLEPGTLYYGIVNMLRDLNALKTSDSFSVEELYFVSNRSDRVEELRSWLDRFL